MKYLSVIQMLLVVAVLTIPVVGCIVDGRSLMAIIGGALIYVTLFISGYTLRDLRKR